MTDPTAVLSKWGSLGAASSSRQHRRVELRCVRLLINAAKEKLSAEAEKLQKLLARSDHALKPLSDPFRLDLGLHRWLADDREESYSDWLQWVVKQAYMPSRVFRLFGQSCPPDLIDTDAQSLDVHREFLVQKGYDGHSGRLDLFIAYRSVARLVVELKTTEADISETGKNRGYCESIPAEAKKILLAIAGAKTEYDGFQLFRWRDFCIEARRLARLLISENKVMIAAQVLAFTSAVEQNVLGFSAETVRAVCSGQMGMFNAGLIDHLESSLR